MKILAVAVATAALAVAAGCGGGSSNAVDPPVWSSGVCKAAGAWVTDIQAQAETLGDSLTSSTTIPEVRDKLVQFLDDAIARTDEMLDEVEAAGEPDVDDGGEIADFLLDELTSFKTALEEARTKAEALPDDPTAFTAGTTEIGASLEKVGSEAGQGIEDLQKKYTSPELTKAFDEDPDCQALDAS